MTYKNKIFVECRTDRELVLSLGFDERCIICAGGIGEVSNMLEKKSADSCGLVDEDPTKTRPKYLRNLLRDNVILIDHDVIVAYDNNRNNRLIALSPDREEWIVRTAKILGINLRDFNLPNDPKEFKRISLIDRRGRVKRLIDQIMNKNHPRVNTLRNAFSPCKCD